MTSSDLYTMVATLSLVIFTIFCCGALFYLIMILRRIHLMMDSIEDFFGNFSGSVREALLRIQTLREFAELVIKGVRSINGASKERAKRAKKETSE